MPHPSILPSSPLFSSLITHVILLHLPVSTTNRHHRSFIHPDNIQYRDHRRVPIAAIGPSWWRHPSYLLKCEAVIAEPSPWAPRGMERYLAPELRYGQARHTEATDAYAFAKVALDMIAAACEGLYPDLDGFFEEGVRVVYVEVLKGLEDVLGADYVLDFGDGVGGDDDDEKEEEDDDDDDNNDDEDEDMKKTCGRGRIKRGRVRRRLTRASLAGLLLRLVVVAVVAV
jgi:hypothetical protein